jgi:prepilin-type N-terminal cleavage/methylation domain-containing protein
LALEAVTKTPTIDQNQMVRDMEKPALFLKVIQHLYQKQMQIKRQAATTDAGYTLIELLVVAIMIGILATIAAPSWLSFVQQRRVSKVNDLVLSALQEAQSQAKNKKLSYSVSFRTPAATGVTEFAIYPTKRPNGTDVDPTNLADFNQGAWRSLGKDLAIQKGQILIGTNLNGENKKTNNFTYNSDNANTHKITFNYLGALPTNSDVDLTVAVASPTSNTSTTPLEPTIRCVKVTTLLGSITPGRNKAECGA